MGRKINSLLLIGLALLLPTITIQGVFAQTKKEAQISPQVLQQIGSILAEKESRTANQSKMSFQLEASMKSLRGESVAGGIEANDSTFMKNDKGQIAVDIQAKITPELLTKIKQIGGEIIFSSEKNNFIQVYVPLLELDRLTESTDVKSIVASYKGEISRRDLKEKSFFNFFGKDTNVAQFGSVTSQGDVTHRANLARSSFGINGSGVKVGVISDSVRFLAETQALGDLPNVTVISGQSGVLPNGGDTGEGTAMLEIVNDLAPGAQLFFSTGFSNGLQNPFVFANNIRALRAAGCDIIVDDLVSTFGPDGTPFQDAIVAQAINEVTASGAVYFSSAGNAGNINDGTSGVWEGDFKDSGQQITVNGNKLATLHDFGTNELEKVVTSPGGVYLLYWADALGSSANDYDLFLVNAEGTAIISGSASVQDGNGFPVEGFGGANAQNVAGVRLLITRKVGSQPRALHLNTNRGRLLNGTNGQIRGHNGAANALSIAATPAGPFTPSAGPVGPFPNAFTFFNEEVERFSSDGPRRIFYNIDGSPIRNGNFLFRTRGGRLLRKPELTAADGVSTTSPNPGLNPFFGTSASAPHAAAIAALVKSANFNLNRQQIISFLNFSAIDIEAFGRDQDSGAGIIDAFNAVAIAGGNSNSSSCSTTFSNGTCTINRCLNGNCTTETFTPTPSRQCSCQTSNLK